MPTFCTDHIDLPQGIHPELAPRANAAHIFPPIAEDVALDIEEGQKVMLIGHTGSGKTSLVEQMAARIGQGCLRVNMNGQTSISDFVGFWTVKGGQTEWVDGVLPKAMKMGLWLIIDEIDCAEASILAALNAVLEPAGRLMLKEKGAELVEPHERFRLFATANAVGSMSVFRHLYQGANLMNEAFLDRWRVYRVDYLSVSDESRAIHGALGGALDLDNCSAVARVAEMARRAFEAEEVECTFSTRRAIDWAALMARGKSPLAAARSSIAPKVCQADADFIEALIDLVWDEQAAEEEARERLTVSRAKRGLPREQMLAA